MSKKSTPSKLPLQGVMLEPDLENFIKARKKFGSQKKASAGLGYYGQTVVSYIETGRTQLDSRNYTIMMLLGLEHPTYELKAKPEATSIDDFIVKVTEKPKSQMPPKELEKALSDISYELIQARTEANLTQQELALAMDCSETTIRNYENGFGLASERFYTIFLLIFNKHPYFELKPKRKASKKKETEIQEEDLEDS